MNDLNQVLNQFGYRVAAEIANEAQDIAPTITRNLRNDIKVFEEGDLHFSVGNSQLAFYAIWVHNGTGLYGPLKKRIYPRTKKALAFMYKGAKVVCQSTKGQRPQPYLKNAVTTYFNTGGLDGAVSALASEIGDSLAELVKKQLKNAD